MSRSSQSISTTHGHSESTSIGRAESRSEGNGWGCGGTCQSPSCPVCWPKSSHEGVTINETYVILPSPSSNGASTPDTTELLRLNGHLDAALRLLRNAALIFRDTAYDLEELVHHIEAARRRESQ